MNVLLWIVAVLAGLVGLVFFGASSGFALAAWFNPEAILDIARQGLQSEQLGPIEAQIAGIAELPSHKFWMFSGAMLMASLASLLLLFRAGLAQFFALLAALVSLADHGFDELAGGFSTDAVMAVVTAALPYLILWVVTLVVARRD